MQLVVYAMTPVWIGGLLVLYPPIGIIGLFFGLYGLYILYLGFPDMMKTSQEKTYRMHLSPSSLCSLLVSDLFLSIR